MDKHIVVQPYNRILISKNKEQISNTINNMNQSQKHNTNSKKLDIKAAYCMIPFIRCSGKEKSIGKEVRSVVARG